MAITASYNGTNGKLVIDGDALDNNETISRNAAGTILVNGGAVAVAGGPATVNSTVLVQVYGQAGNDTLTMDEANGALPEADLFGGLGNDRLTGGARADFLYGQEDNDTLFGKGGSDRLHGDDGNDILAGGTGQDRLFGDDGDDRMIWNSGDDNDLFEGGNGFDVAEINGDNDAEAFTATASGTRVVFDRVTPVPSFLGIDSTEYLILNMNGGDDTFSASGDLAALMRFYVDGGAGNDTILGSNGADTLLGGDGNDTIDGNQGNDTAFLGAGRDVFVWDSGDGSDIVEGQDSYDALAFNGSAGSENIALSANGGRARLTQDIGNVSMDLNDVEAVIVKALAGSDRITVGNMTGTEVSEVSIDLAGDGAADSVVVNATDGNDIIRVSGFAIGSTRGGSALATYSITGASALVSVQSSGGEDQLTLNGLGGDDAMSVLQMAGDTFVVLDGGDGNDTITGNSHANRIIGGNGNDYLVGMGGDDTLIDGSGVNTLQGGTGNDRYAVQSLDDTVYELAGEGIDEVQTFLASYTLRPNVEDLTFVNGTFSHTGVGTTENNRFTGAGGNDTFTGAGGADIFTYRLASNGHDTITDFDAANGSTGHDQIDFTGRGLNFAALTITAGADGTTVATANGDSILLKGVFGGIDAGDFFF